MTKTKKIIIGIISAAVLAAVMLVGVTGFGLYRYVSAAVTPTPVPGSATPNIMGQYWSLFLKSFAQNLGVDQGKLNSAFVAAINSTVDQAVKDGKMTQSQADSIKSRYSTGLSGMQNGFQVFGLGRGLGRAGRPGMQFLTNADIAKALNMSETDLMTALQSGKSIATIASDQKVDLNTLKSTLLQDMKTRLDSEVTNKTLTQAQADQFYQNFSNSIDNLLNSTRGFAAPFGFGRGRGMMGFGSYITTTDIANALGMSEADMNTALQSGKSIATIASDQKKDLTQVKTTLLADAKTRLDAAVTAKTLTQAQADTIYQKLTTSIDSMLNSTFQFKGGHNWFNHQGFPGNRKSGQSQGTGA